MERIIFFKNEIDKLFQKEKPDGVCFEGIQYQHNFATYQRLAQLQGVIISSLINFDIPFIIVPSGTWRNFIGIKGRTKKEKKQFSIDYVKEKFDIDCTDDVADSICIGLWSVNNFKKCLLKDSQL